MSRQGRLTVAVFLIFAAAFVVAFVVLPDTT